VIPITVLSSQPQVTTPVLDDEQAPLYVTCPLCHTGSLPQRAIEAGAGWRCVTCGQIRGARRLSSVAAYAAWVVERAASLSHNVPIEQLDGRT